MGNWHYNPNKCSHSHTYDWQGRAHFAVKSPVLTTHSITTLQRRHNLIRLNLKISSFHVNHHANVSKIAPSPKPILE